MAKRTTTSCKNLRLVQIRKISNCLLISTNVLSMVFLLYLLHSLNLHSNWSFNVLSTSYMFMEFQYGEGILQCFAREQEYISRLVMQYWIQWTWLDSIIVLEYKRWQWWLDYWLFSITILIFHQHGDQRLTVILSWSKWRQMAGLLEQNQRFGFDYFLSARSARIEF